MEKIRARDRDVIIQSLRAGVVPKRGLQHIQVGRVNEIKALLDDLDSITNGGSAFRLIIGEYGSGKTFFIQLIRSIACEKGLVTAHADLNPDRRIQATGGQARNLYAELMKNLSTRTKPDGNGIGSIVERFISSARTIAEEKKESVESVIQKRLSSLSEYVGGYDFANVIAAYWKGYENSNDNLMKDAIRWLRAEFSTKTEARQSLDVRNIIDDSNVYDHLKIMSLFVRQAGYSGLLVCLDEMVNLYKMTNVQARCANYEQILRILNDSLQGGSESLGFLMGGTPEFLLDTRRGLYSYEALQTRLAENSFAKMQGVMDYKSPALHLANLTQEDLYILLTKLRSVYALGDENNYLIPDEALEAFMIHCFEKIGDSYFKTPRNTIKAFLDLLAVLEQNKEIKWTDLLKQVEVPPDVPEDIMAAANVTYEPQGKANNDANEAWANFKL